MKERNILYSLDQLPKNCKIALYGSGKIGLGFKSLIEKNRNDLLVNCFINTFSNGKKDDLQIIKVADLHKHSNVFDIIVICSSLWNEIEDELVKRNYRYEYCTLSNELIYETLDISSLGSFRFEENERDEIRLRLNRVLSWFDSDDNEGYNVLIDLRLLNDESKIFEFLKYVNKRFKIPYLDYIDINKGNVIIEGGVFDGTDSVNFYKFSRNVNLRIYGFDPSIEAFDLSPNRSMLIEKGMEIFPWALWDKNQSLFFDKSMPSSSSSRIIRNELALSDRLMNRKIMVKGLTIDSFVEKKDIDSISLIKLDIEGAEMEALRGAKETIGKFKPQLAISIYHKKEHLFEIPELIKEINPDYELKLGFYSPTFIDTVLYAVP